MATRPRSVPLMVAAFLVFAALFAPVSPVSAARPVCATSKKADIKRHARLETDKPRQVWARVCYASGALKVSVYQKHFGRGQNVEQTIDAEVKVTVYSTTTNGRFLKDTEYEQVVSLGDLAVKFSSGAADRFGYLKYLPSVEGPATALPALRPGVYRIAFEMVLYPADQSTGDPGAPVSTGVKFIKVKV